MGRLSEYDDLEREHIAGTPRSSDRAEHNNRDEYLTGAYTSGRNAARDGKARIDIADIYACDSLAAINWECGYDDYYGEQQDDFDLQRRPQW